MDFWRLTPEEFAVKLQGYTMRQAKDYQRAAWMVAQLLSPYVKKGRQAPTPDSLLSPALKRILRGPQAKPQDDD